MPVKLQRNERRLLIGAGILLLALAGASVIVAPPEAGRGGGGASTYSANWGGSKAAYLLLESLGYNVRRWESSPLDLPQDDAEEHGVLILAEPTVSATKEEKIAIRVFLQRGGTVVATGSKASGLLPDVTSFEEGLPFADFEQFHPVALSPLVRGVSEINMRPPLDGGPSAKTAEVIFSGAQKAGVITVPIGKGRVIWWAESYPLTNGGLRSLDNATFFLNCMGAPAGQPIYWDEYFHGVQNSFWTYLARTPVPWGMAQIGILFAAILVTHSRRNGPIRVPQGHSRLSPLEFVETLGDLYHEAHAGTAAVKILYERLRFQLLRSLALPANVGAKELAKSASEALRWDRPDLTEALEQGELAKRGVPMQEEEALALVKRLYTYSKKLEPGSVPEKKRTRE